ncbi:hypothetical protein IW261DRAFT_1524525 [Armillaria novae-zelandiae]|uniref:Uncharacterized protein n=1 Tax=Armillaria novae-zelandiae TaxID=153914 RepID=A0AA39TUV0_9AGAR|nr:hypothetical protein IW261DRAFT_1524525 [Armillaria novae-zelandiae]
MIVWTFLIFVLYDHLIFLRAFHRQTGRSYIPSISRRVYPFIFPKTFVATLDLAAFYCIGPHTTPFKNLVFEMLLLPRLCWGPIICGESS